MNVAVSDSGKPSSKRVKPTGRKTMFGRTNPKFVKYKSTEEKNRKIGLAKGSYYTQFVISMVIAAAVTYLLNITSDIKKILDTISIVGYIILFAVIVSLIIIAVIRMNKIKKMKQREEE